MNTNLDGVDIIMLCGGLGTRLRSVVADRPKPMAEVKEKPFLELIVRYLLGQGFQRIVFCTGYLGDQIENYFRSHPLSKKAEFVFSREEKPLGTGGAVKRALNLVKSNDFFVMNGDTASRINFKEMYRQHIKKQTPLSMAVVPRHFSNGQGNILLAKNDTINSFVEHGANNPGKHANSGCYVMSKYILNYFPDAEVFSLELDVFPKLAGQACGYITNVKFLDIGTPERYASAEKFLLE